MTTKDQFIAEKMAELRCGPDVLRKTLYREDLEAALWDAWDAGFAQGAIVVLEKRSDANRVDFNQERKSALKRLATLTEKGGVEGEAGV